MYHSNLLILWWKQELLELSERIGNVNTGLKEDEIVHCLRKAKHMDNLFSPLPKEMEQKCSICQVGSSVVFIATLFSELSLSKHDLSFLYAF